MRSRHFFGYGSLVNRATHDYDGAFPARLTGWRRAWRRSPTRALCYLTALPAQGQEILGLVSPVPMAAQGQLDKREQAYGRTDVSARLRHDTTPAPEVEIHAIPDGHHHDPTEENPILLSYLDVVVQGYLSEFGKEGVQHFFDTTDGWQAPVLDDRAAPVYPRAQALQAEETRLVNEMLEDTGSRILRAPPSSWDKYLWGVRGAEPPDRSR